MAIEHMVWMKFRPGVADAAVGQHMKALAGLAGSVPGIASLRLGRNFTDRAGGYTHGMIVTFPSRKELEAYLPHPNHQTVAVPLKRDAELLVMDIEW